MGRRIGALESPVGYFARLWLAAGSSAALAWTLRILLHPHRPIVAALVILLPYGLAYLGLAATMGVDQAGALWKRLKARR